MKRFARLLGLALLYVGLLFVSIGSAKAEPLRVLIPDPQNLQYMAFWVAQGAGLFSEEGLTIELVSPDHPKASRSAIEHGEADAFVLPPPLALDLAASNVPIVLVANLLANDPINLIVRGTIARERGITAEAQLGETLHKFAGLRIGVAPGPPPRLRALFASVGLDVEKETTVVIVGGHEQNAAFGEGRIDALYAHTPYLEKALLEQGATLVVHQSKGAIPALSTRQIHTLGVMRAYRDSHRTSVAALVRAIARAEDRIHASKPEAVNAILATFPKMDRRHVELIVDLYEPAIPKSASVSAEGLRSAIPLFPPTRASVDPAAIDFTHYVDDSFATTPFAGGTRRVNYFAWSASALALALAAVAVRWLRRRARVSSAQSLQ